MLAGAGLYQQNLPLRDVPTSIRSQNATSFVLLMIGLAERKLQLELLSHHLAATANLNGLSRHESNIKILETPSTGSR